MNEFLTKLTEILGFAGSKNATDRRKFRDQLLDIYANDECVEAINIDTAANFNSPASWNEIMLAIHRSALMEAEKIGVRTSANAAKIAQSSIAALMFKTINLATNTATISLNRDDLMALFFQVWRNEIYKPYHDTYMNIFIRFVLTNEMYWIKITTQQWQEVLNLSMKMYAGSSDIFKNTLLDAMRLVVQYGCSQTRLMLDVKNMLPFLEKVFQDIGTAKDEILKALYNLTYTVGLQIGTESRFALCEFSEHCFPPIICLEGCPEMYKMLLLFVQIHHPGGGLTPNEDVDYACNSKGWNSIMRGIYGSIFRNMKTEKLEPNLLKLACEVCRQILKDPSYLVEASCSRANTQDQYNARKFCRLTMPVEKPIDILLMKKDLRSNWPFIQILASLLRKYPETLESGDYPELMKLVASFVEQSLDNEMVLGSLCELLAVLIENEKQPYFEAKHVNDVEVFWQNIWETVLRASSMNKNQVSCHQLLQLMIKHKNVSTSLAFPLYLNKLIIWSSSSVETLLSLCIHSSIPSDESLSPGISEFSKAKSSTKDSLLKWALDISSSKSSTEIPVDSLGNLLTELVIKSSYNRGFCGSRNKTSTTDRPYIALAFQSSLENELLDDWEEKALNDIERSNLALIFKLELFENTAESTEIDLKETISTHEIAGDLFEILISSLNVSLAKPQLKKKEISMWITKASVVAKILSNFTKLNVDFGSQQVSRLVETFRETFTNILDILMTKHSFLSYVSEKEEEPIEAFEKLYCSRYHRNIEKIIIDLTPSDFIQHLNNLILVKNSEKCKISCGRDRNLSAAEKIVTYYSCASIGDQMTSTQKKVLENCTQFMENGQCTIKNSRCIRTALRFLTAFSFFGQQSINDDFVEIAIQFIRQLLRLGEEDDRIVRTVLKIIPPLMKTSKSISSVDSLVSIITRIKKIIANENYGPHVVAEFVQCLSKVICINPLLKWRLSRISDSTQPIIHSLLIYITNPFYFVRLEALQAFFAVFSSQQLDVHWKLEFLEKIILEITNLLGNEDPNADEIATKKTTALYLLSVIIRSNDSRQLQSRALFAMIKLSVEKNIKAATIKKALLLSSTTTKNRETWPRKLVEINLQKLLSRFLEVDYQLDKFPWILTGCCCFEDFLKLYIETLVIIKLQRLQFEEIQILCNNLDISFAQTTVDCFASILALITSMSVRNSTNDPEKQRAARYASEIHGELRQNIGKFSNVTKFVTLIRNKKTIPKIVIEFVTRLHDQQNFAAIFETDVALPICENEPNLDVKTLEKCLRSFENDLSIESYSLVEHLVIKNPKILQEILMSLASNIYDVKSTDYELLAFHQWAYFYMLVIEKISESYFDSMSFYIVRDISHSLLGFIKEETVLSELACSYFEKFLTYALPKRGNEIQEILSFIVSSLIPIIKRGKVDGAISLLRYLIVQQERILAKAIEKLDSFPNEKVFIDIKQVHNRLKYGGNKSYSLEQEIEHFLNATTNKTLNCSLEGLSHLNDQLSSKKHDLREMYRNLEGLRGFAEDCASSTLHRLMHKLVQLTLSCDAEISLEAAKCLGELGPADLTTIILQPETGYGKESDEQAEQVENFTVEVINHLSEYLVDHDIELRKATVAALQSIFDSSTKQLSTKSYLHEKMKLLYGIENSSLYYCVYPFVNRTRGKIDDFVSPIHIEDNNLDILIKSTDLWIPKNYGNYSDWIIDITSKILECFSFSYTTNLKPICKRSVKFSDIVFPRLINLLISAKNSVVDKLCSCINRFFKHLFESICRFKDSFSADTCLTPEKNGSGHEDVSRSHECVRSMLNVVNFMRIQSLKNNKDLSFDYLLIANAADYISAHFTSLLYAELWGQNFVETSGLLREKLPGSWISAIDSICEVNPSSGKLLQHIVREAYLHIGDPDSIYGCGHSDSLDSSIFRTQYYTHLRQWDKVMLEQDIELNHSPNATCRDMLNALQKSGHQYLLGLVINSTNGRSENNDFMYEAAWRLADWSSFESSRVIDTIQDHAEIAGDSKNHNYHALHYRALVCLRDGNVAGLADSLMKARSSIVDSLRKTILECTQTMYPLLSKLQMLREIEEFAAVTRESDGNINQLIDDWDNQDFVNTHDLQYLEPILAQRLAMYQIVKSHDDKKAFMDLAIINTHLKMARIAEKQGYLSMASRALDTLGEEIDIPDAAFHNLVYRKAMLAWKEEEHGISRCFIADLIKKPSLDPKLRAKALRICGNWMAETKCEKPQTIIDDYYEKSICTSMELEVPAFNDIRTLTGAQADLGQFADAQYQQIIRFTKSAQYEYLVKSVKNEDNEDDRALSAARAKTESMATYHQQIIDDAAELENIKRKKDTYLVLSAKNYLQTLQNGNDHDVLIFRLVSLWLDNTFHEELNEILQENLPRVASYKFITLLCQLAPHLSNVSNDFTDKINDLMERCAKEHPHHTLPVLFALKNTYKDEEYKPVEGGFRKNSNRCSESRVIAANSLIAQLLKSEIRPIIKEISRVSDALVMLAYYKVPADEAKKCDVLKIPGAQAITRIRHFNHTIVPTITMDVNPSGNYDTIVGIREYEANFKLPGGVNAPKNIICIGSDGVRRRQLVKGQDDLRQDAVMQQVCTVMNSMLKASRETKRRRLHIRTYKIVPLSRRSGVLEWCENTLPMSHVLTDSGGKKGLHSKYYPNDWKTDKCRSKLKAVQTASRQVQLETFLDCCKNLHPAFHHFFLEKYPSAEMWFERRLAYVRSVASTSMVGYMLGLGDRHFSNILIDQTTAEVIHIDFGIAFAQGKVLPIPETVPFRLTRDMEVAMGICGVEGVMRRCCEETMAVLRDKRKILITVLQVLLYDPLFSWAITPVKTNDLDVASSQFTRGHTDDQENKKTNEIAKKALRIIDEKLQGTTDGRTLSIPGQVERLIQQARDPSNLCRLFCGWQPYL